MATVDAWDLPGGDGDTVILPTGLPHLRTGVGSPARTIIAIVNFDDLNQAQRGAIWSARRTSNNSISHAMVFDPTGNNVEYQYASTPVFEWTTNSETAADVWLAVCYCDGGNGNDITVRRIPLASHATTHAASGASGGSVFSDSQPQTFTLGAANNGGYIQELNGQIAFFLYIDGVSLTQAQCEAFAADPLNNGDDLIETYGSAVYFWDDSGDDVGPNNLGTPTLNGSATRGTGNGPDVPTRIAPPIPDAPEITSVGPANDNIFVGEPGVEIVGNTFGPVRGTGKVYWSDASTLGGSANEVEQTGTILWSDSLITIVDEVAIAPLTVGSRHCIVLNDAGQEGSLPVTIQANPGENIGSRGNPPSQTLTVGTPFTLDAGSYLFLDAQAEASLTFSVRSGALPSGLTLSPDGTISGIVGGDAVTSTVEVQGVDELGAFASDEFSFQVTSGSRLLRRIQDLDLTRPVMPGIAVTQVSQSQNDVSFSAASDSPTHASELVSGVAGYRIYRDGVLRSDQAGLTFSDTGLSTWTNYTYTVEAYDASGNVSVRSNPLTVRTLDQTAPSVPTITATQTGQTSISVALTTASTDPHSGLSAYELEYKRTVDTPWTVHSTTGTTFPRSITGLIAGTQYQTRARARDASGNLSAYSAISTATTQAPADVTAPTQPVIAISATTSSSITVSLQTASTDVGGSGVAAYHLEYRVTGAPSFTIFSTTLPSPFTPQTISGLTASTSYDIRCRARDNANNLSTYHTISQFTQAATGGGALADWNSRIAGPGVVWAQRFTTAQDVDKGKINNNPNIRLVTTDGIIGDGCLEMDVPAGQGGGGSWARPMGPINGDINNAGLNPLGFSITNNAQVTERFNNMTGGHFGHASYQSGSWPWPTSRFVGTDFYFQYRVKFGPNRFNTNEPTSKMLFLATNYLGTVAQEIAVLGYVSGTPGLNGLYYQYTSGGSNFNSFLDSSQQQNTGAAIQPGGPFDATCKIGGPFTCFTWQANVWYTVLIHVIPGRQFVVADVNHPSNPRDTGIQVWVARADESAYTKIWDKLDYVWYYDDRQESSGSSVPMPFGFNWIIFSPFTGGGVALPSPAGWYHRHDQLIFSTQFIPCPQPGAGPSDTTPDQFTFTDQAGVALSSTITSAPITVTGIGAASPITVTGGTYDKNSSGSFTSSAGTVVNNDTVRARHTSSASNSTATNTVVTIGGVSDTFTSTTVAASGSAPAWFSALTSQRWALISNGAGQRIDDNGPSPSPPGGLNGVCDAWTGGCVNQTGREFILCANGGHEDYAGNETYAINLSAATPAWTRLDNPTPNSQIDGKGELGGLSQHGPTTANRYADGRMRSYHGWNRQVFCDGEIFIPGNNAVYDSGFTSNACWRVPRSTLTHTYIGQGFSTISGGNMNLEAGSSCADPIGHVIYSSCESGVNGNGHSFFRMLSQSPYTRTDIPLSVPGNRRIVFGVVAPDLRIILWGCSDGVILVGDISSGTFTSLTEKTPTGSPTFSNFNGQGAVYHAPSRALFGWFNGGTTLRKLTIPANPITGTYVQSSVAAVGGGVTPANQAGQGIFSKFNIVDNMGDGRACIVLQVQTNQGLYVYPIPAAGM